MGTPRAEVRSLYDELQHADELIDEANEQARWRRTEMVNALTIREVDRTLWWQQQVRDCQLDRLFLWEPGA